MTCWMAFFTQRSSGTRRRDGTLFKLRSFKCSKTWKCVDALISMMLREETETITSEGLETKFNPSGVDLCLIWFDKECHHPQKKQIIEHWKSTPCFEKLVIPHSVLKELSK